MKLNLCQSCSQHILQHTTCPHCQKPSNVASLTLPMALILGIGCAKKESAPTPEVMALYGGPPVEIQEVELQTEDTGTTEKSEKPPVENVEQSEGTTNTNDTESEEDTTEIEPDPVEATIKPMYGVDVTPMEPTK
jgi:hypothetical protein